jgi:hypothetical protein
MKALDKIISTLTSERTFNVENYKLKGTAMADERKQAALEAGATNISKLLDKTGDVATGEFLKQVVEMNNKRKEHEANLYKEAMKEDKQLQRTREEIASREKVATMPQREAPKEVVVTMKDGSKTYGTMLAGQIQVDGKPVDRSEVKNVNLVSGESKAGMGGVGQIQFRYNGALASASNRLSTHVENFGSILQSSAPPGLGQVITSERTVPTAVLKYLGASITDAENRAFQQQLAPLIREVAVVESAGRPGGMTESAIKEYQQMAPVGGDNKISTYLFLALVKQEAEFAKDSLEASGGTPEQMNIAQRGLDKINKVVTWDVNDINRILRGPNGKQLVSPKIEQMLTHSNSLEEFSNQMTASETPTAGQWTVTEK